MIYLAHKTEAGEEQTIYQHLTQTAKLAEDFSVPLLKSIAYSAGLAHDIGKYAVNFQKRLDGNSTRFEHAVCGAIEYQKLAEKSKSFYEYAIAYLLAYCIAGHHTGLPDGGSRGDKPDDDCTLYARLKREYTGDSDYQAFQKEISLDIPDSPELIQILKNFISKKEYSEFLEQFAFFTRYIFSCLTDADFLDTEKFCNPNIDRSTKEDFEKSLFKVQEKLDSFKHETSLQKARAKIQEQAFASAEKSADISILNMPTGSGKTLCSLKIALEKVLASHGKKKRIIYVIPFTSIIEQTAEEFENLFGKYTDILQHHSNYDFDTKSKQDDKKEKSAEEEPDTVQKMKLASENWNVPVIVTTSVQFFESLYHYRSSRLRKLHNIADSVIIFDEIHTLPLQYLIPCLKGIGYLTKYLNSEAIFLSATMPDYSELFQKHLPKCTIQELVPDKSDFSYFQKCSYYWLGQTDFETIIQKTENYQSSLIIVNKKDTAHELYQMLDGKKFHLSTNMTPCDRSETIQKIRKALENKEKITVVSTSLIEAGVDLDFETVFRELAGLDSILQAGGRCNREGRRQIGDVFVFSTDMKMKGEFQIRSEITSYLLKKYGEEITSSQCIQEYYHSLFQEHSDKLQSKTLQEFQGTNTKTLSIPFRSYAELNQDWNENALVVKANLMHEHVHDGSHSFSDTRKIVRSDIAVWNDSPEYNLFGRTDCIEFIRQKEETEIPALNGIFSVRIIEYKPNAPKTELFHETDAIQVFAQKLCADYVWNCDSECFIYYDNIRKRVKLPFDTEYRHYDTLLKSLLSEMRQILQAKTIPPRKKGQKCSGCSLADFCFPKEKKYNIKNQIMSMKEENAT